MNEHAEGARFNREAFEYAQRLIQEGHVIVDDHSEWYAMQPTPEQEDEFVRKHGYKEYSRWFLGIDYKHPVDSKERYKFPYGNFHDVLRSGCIAAEARAGQYKYFKIEEAAHTLKIMLDKIKEERAAS